MKKFFTKEYLKELFYVTLGNLLVAVSFSFFLDPLNVVMGGATGAATILKCLLKHYIVQLCCHFLLVYVILFMVY